MKAYVIAIRYGQWIVEPEDSLEDAIGSIQGGNEWNSWSGLGVYHDGVFYPCVTDTTNTKEAKHTFNQFKKLVIDKHFSSDFNLNNLDKLKLGKPFSTCNNEES